MLYTNAKLNNCDNGLSSAEEKIPQLFVFFYTCKNLIFLSVVQERFPRQKTNGISCSVAEGNNVFHKRLIIIDCYNSQKYVLSALIHYLLENNAKKQLNKTSFDCNMDRVMVTLW